MAAAVREITADVNTILNGNWGDAPLWVELLTAVAIDNDEIHPVQRYKFTLAADGTLAFSLPVPATGAWNWRFRLPDNNLYDVPIGAGTAVTLASLLAAAYPPAENPTLDLYYVRRDGTNTPMTGELLLSGDPVDAVGAATKQYVDNSPPIGLSNVLWVDPSFTAATPGWGVTAFNNLGSAIAIAASVAAIYINGRIQTVVEIISNKSITLFGNGDLDGILSNPTITISGTGALYLKNGVNINGVQGIKMDGASTKLYIDNGYASVITVTSASIVELLNSSIGSLSFTTVPSTFLIENCAISGAIGAAPSSAELPIYNSSANSLGVNWTIDPLNDSNTVGGKTYREVVATSALPTASTVAGAIAATSDGGAVSTPALMYSDGTSWITWDDEGSADDAQAFAIQRANHTGSQSSSTISDFAATVRATVLTGLSTATNAVITATDTVLTALGKLQAQITGHVSATGTAVHGLGSASLLNVGISDVFVDAYNRVFTVADGLITSVNTEIIAFESTKTTITPSVTLASGSLTWLVVESDGAIFTYSTPSFTHTKTAVGNLKFYLYGSLDQITAMDSNNDGLIGTFTANNLLSRLPSLIELRLYSNASLVCSFALADLPATMTQLYLYNTSSTITGALADLPATMTQLYLYNTSSTITGGATTIQAIGVRNIEIQSTSASQANVDDVLLRIWTDRALFNTNTHALNVGGTNPAPTGIYQTSVTPSTGKEYAYDLVNDGNAEGFKLWTVTFTA